MSTVKILWTKNKLPLSHLICAVTKEPVSHVVVCQHGQVMHASITGVKTIPEEVFRKKNTIVFELEGQVPDSWFSEQVLRWVNKPYDLGAMFFLGISLLLRRYLKLPLPKSNLWQSSGMFLCTEWASLVTEEKADSMITPFGLYKRLLTTSLTYKNIPSNINAELNPGRPNDKSE